MDIAAGVSGRSPVFTITGWGTIYFLALYLTEHINVTGHSFPGAPAAQDKWFGPGIGGRQCSVQGVFPGSPRPKVLQVGMQAQP